MQMLKNAVFIKTQKISIWKIMHGCLNIWNFASIVELDNSRVSCAHSLHIELNRRNEIPYLQFGLLYKYLSNKKKPTEFTFYEKTLCHSFVPLNRGSDMSAADWLPQTHVKNYRIAVHVW